MLFTFFQKIRYSVKLLDFQSEQIQTNSVDFQFSMYHNHHFAFHFNISQQIHLARSRESFHCKKLNTFMESLTQNISISSKIFTKNIQKKYLELAVLVFVHGESWSWGSSALYDARILATLGRIIVVTFNYRLGVFGKIFINI